MINQYDPGNVNIYFSGNGNKQEEGASSPPDGIQSVISAIGERSLSDSIPSKRQCVFTLNLPDIFADDESLLRLQRAIDFPGNSTPLNEFPQQTEVVFQAFESCKINVVNISDIEAISTEEAEVEMDSYEILQVNDLPASDSVRCLVTHNLKSCIAVNVRCLGADNELLAIGLAHDVQLENVTKEFLDDLLENFPETEKLEIFLIGGDVECDEKDELTPYEGILDEIQAHLYENLRIQIVEKRINIYNVVKTIDEKYGELWCSQASDLIGYSVSAGITENGQVFMARGALVGEYDEKLVKVLSMLIGYYEDDKVNRDDIPVAASLCAQDPDLQSKFITLLTKIFFEDKWVAASTKNDLIGGLKLFLTELASIQQSS